MPWEERRWGLVPLHFFVVAKIDILQALEIGTEAFLLVQRPHPSHIFKFDSVVSDWYCLLKTKLKIQNIWSVLNLFSLKITIRLV